MGLFSRKAPRPQLQYPDELAERAELEYGHQQFAAALATYADAIDRLHSMYVAVDRASRIRTPGAQDQSILDGINSALGASLAIDPQLEVASTVDSSIAYLRQIADEAGAESGRYLTAIEAVELTYRLGYREKGA